LKIRKSAIILLAVLTSLLLIVECKTKEDSNMRLSSPEFKHNAFIPSKFTCQGESVNPALIIEGIPSGTKSLALIIDDPDALRVNFVHWVVYDIAVTSRIEENSIPGKQGVNSLGGVDYVGPCPPTGAHRYFFKIYALDKMLDLGEVINKPGLEKAIGPHILDKAELVGLYKKK
jgi:hypothetical protein